MSFTFIHTADWQIGKPFGRLPESVAALLGEARYGAVDTIAGVAREHSARHVLVAGDVFDSKTPPQHTLDRLLARLAAHSDVVWHLLPGNHDPAQPGAVWDDLARRSPPSNVHSHTTPAPIEIEPGVVLIPAPLSARAMSTDPTAFMDQVTSARGVIRIGMAHGSVGAFSSEGEPTIPIDAARTQRARLDYLALGDWHGQVRINARTWYSGTPEPDGYKDNGSGQALAVTIPAAGQDPLVRAVVTKHYHWHAEAADITSIGDLERAATALAAICDKPSRLVAKLDLTGAVSLSEHGAIAARLAQLGASFAHLAASTDRIAMRTGSDDLAALGTGSVADVATRLAARASADDATASQALRILARLARQTT